MGSKAARCSGIHDTEVAFRDDPSVKQATEHRKARTFNNVIQKIEGLENCKKLTVNRLFLYALITAAEVIKAGWSLTGNLCCWTYDLFARCETLVFPPENKGGVPIVLPS